MTLHHIMLNQKIKVLLNVQGSGKVGFGIKFTLEEGISHSYC